MRTIATLLCTLLLMTTGFAQKAKLSLNLEEGKTYRQITHSVTTLNQDVYGQKMEILITVEGSMSFLVNTATKTGYDMTARYDWMKISMGMPMGQGTMELSSEDPSEDDFISQFLAEVKLIPFQMKMDRKGKILEMENVDEKWETALEKIPTAQAEQMKSQMMDAFGEDARIASIEKVTAVFPEKAVKKGAQWTSTTSQKTGMSFTLSNTYTYEGSEDGLAIISVRSSIETADKEAWVENSGMTMRYELSGLASGQIKLDEKSGWTREASLEQNLEGKTHIKDSEQIPGGIEIPMTIKTETKTTDE